VAWPPWEVEQEQAKGEEAKVPPIAFTGHEASVQGATHAATTTTLTWLQFLQVTGFVLDAVITSLLAISNAVSVELQSQRMPEEASDLRKAEAVEWVHRRMARVVA